MFINFPAGPLPAIFIFKHPKADFYCCLDTYGCCPGMTSDEALQEFGDILQGTSKEYNNLMGSRRIS